MTKKRGYLDLFVLDTPAEEKKLVLQFRRDSRTVVDWVTGHAKLKTKESTVSIV